MQVILSDHNCEGYARLLFNVLRFDGNWLKLVPMKLQWFRDVGLSIKADDETVWCFCQENDYILLTGNRRTDDKEKSLEFVIRRLVTASSLPILTIGNLRRVGSDPLYRRRCAERLAEIVDEIEKYRGVTRLYLP